MKNFFLKIVYRILAAYARAVIRRHNPFVIAITGSVGKGSAKEAIYQVLVDHFGKHKVRKNYGSLNAEIGIPLTILGYTKVPNKFLWPWFFLSALPKLSEKKYPAYLVLEMGVEHPGDIDYFSTIVRPDIAVIISTAPVHLANFKDYRDFQKEKCSLAEKIKPEGIVMVNSDDGFLNRYALNHENIITVGTDSKADYHAESIELKLDGSAFRIETVGQKISVKSKLFGRQFVYSDLFAFAIGHYMGIQSLEIKKSLEKVEPEAGRMRIIAGKKESIIIDDTYNASPVAVKAALDVLSEMESGRKVFIFGNMNELGDYEREAHKEVAEYARGKANLAIFAGPNAKMMSEIFGPGAIVFLNRKELESKIESLIEAKDLILIKASQNNNFFEEITKKLMNDPAEAEKLLVRQGSFWARRKK